MRFQPVLTLIRLAIAEHLRERGFKVYEASDGEEAIQLIEAHRDEINAVFTDIRMATMGTDGLGLALWVNSEMPGIPVVITSGVFRTPQGLVEGESFFRKPYDLTSVAARIDQLTRKDRTAAAG